MALDTHCFEAFDGIGGEDKCPTQSRIGTVVKAGSHDITVETVDQFDRFEALEPHWNALVLRASKPTNVFLCFNWHWHWCRHYLRDNASALRIVAVWSGERLVMVWPLVIERSFGVRELKWMGSPVSQYGDVVVDREFNTDEILDRAWNHITKTISADVIALEKVRDDSPVAPLLENKKGIVTGVLEAPYLNLDSAKDYGDYEKRYSGRSKKNRRRHRRRLGELGPVDVQVLTEGDEARDLVGQTIAAKRRWLETNGLVSRAYSDQRFDAFFCDVAGSRDRPTGCIVSVLSSNSSPVAFDVGFQSGDTYVAHIGAYEASYERFSPGSLLTEDFLRRSYELGIGTYDFMAPKAGYKMAWADDCVVVRDFAFPMSGVGVVYANGVLWFMRNVVKSALENAPAGVRRLTRPLFKMAGL